MVPAESEKQRRLMCLAWSIKKGDRPARASAQAAKIAEGMSLEQLEEYCTSKPTGE